MLDTQTAVQMVETLLNQDDLDRVYTALEAHVPPRARDQLRALLSMDAVTRYLVACMQAGPFSEESLGRTLAELERDSAVLEQNKAYVVGMLRDGLLLRCNALTVH